MMHRRSFLVIAALVGLMPLAARAQTVMPEPPPGMSEALQTVSAPAPSTPQAPVYSQAQMDQLLAPIALYPDPLLGQILMASTYPLEVVEAHRWLQDPQNAALRDGALEQALDAQPWDPSVKSLVAFPQVLAMMDGNLQWTEQLGDAFLAQQPTVMDSVQHLRQMAQAAGNLNSSAQETVTAENGAIAIAPPAAQQVYIPYYNPLAVYGTWPYPDYTPYDFAPPPGYVYYNDGLIGFGAGIVIADWFWGWDRWDWRNHHIDIDDQRWAHLNHGQPPAAAGVWHYDPDHRHGVPFHSAAVRTQFGGAQAQQRVNFRGYAAQPQNRATPSAFHPRAENTIIQPSAPAQDFTPRMHMQSPAQHPVERAAPIQPRMHAAPVFESFSRGPDAHAQAARGATSRASMPAPRAAQAPRAAPAGGGGGHGPEMRR